MSDADGHSEMNGGRAHKLAALPVAHPFSAQTNATVRTSCRWELVHRPIKEIDLPRTLLDLMQRHRTAPAAIALRAFSIRRADRRPSSSRSIVACPLMLISIVIARSSPLKSRIAMRRLADTAAAPTGRPADRPNGATTETPRRHGAECGGDSSSSGRCRCALAASFIHAHLSHGSSCTAHPAPLATATSRRSRQPAERPSRTKIEHREGG